MLRLDLAHAPAWLDLGHGVHLHLAPLTTALMVAARSDPAFAALEEGIAEGASDEMRALVFAKAIARRAVLAWEGVGDTEGNIIAPSPEGIDALLDLYPLFEAFQLGYVNKGLALVQEKNVSAPSPNGTLAGAGATARPAKGRARTARRS